MAAVMAICGPMDASSDEAYPATPVAAVFSEPTSPPIFEPRVAVSFATLWVVLMPFCHWARVAPVSSRTLE